MIRGGREPPSGQLRMVEIQFGGGRPPAARLCRRDATAQVAASASAP